MGAPFDFKFTNDQTLVYTCHADAENASLYGQFFHRLSAKEQRMLRKQDYQCRLSLHFFEK